MDAADRREKTREKPRLGADQAAPSPLADLVAPWLQHLRDADRAPRTVIRYASAVRDFLDWAQAEERRPPTLGDLTPIALVGYRTARQRTAATTTVNTHLCALRAWCAWLTAARALPTNPAAHLKLVGRTGPDAPAALADTAVNALLRAAQRSRHPARDYAIVQMLLQTGMRIGECQALAWPDITLTQKGGLVSIRAGKGNKARTVPLNGSARAALAAYAGPLLKVDPSVQAVAEAWPRRGARPPTSSLWRSQKGRPLSAPALWRVISTLVRDCAARKLAPAETTPHTLRHTFAQRYLRANPGDLVGLARVLGHADLNTTRIYTQPTGSDLAERLEQLPLNAYT